MTPIAEPFLGIMSGTSLDGADAVLADFSNDIPRPLGRAHIPFEATLKQELLLLCSGNVSGELEKAAVAGIALTKIYRDAVELALRDSGFSAGDIVAIG